MQKAAITAYEVTMPAGTYARYKDETRPQWLKRMVGPDLDGWAQRYESETKKEAVA